MPKKSPVRKRATERKKRGVFFYIQRYFVLTVVCLVFFTGTTVILKAQQAQSTCANSKTYNSDLSEKIDNGAVGIFEGKQVRPPKIEPSEVAEETVLGASTSSSDKHIYVDLAAQTLYAYEGTKQIFKTFIASGKWGKTPVGNFHIWEKLRSTRMAGGEGADAYDLPNVPYVMYFFHDFGLHGAYWHDNFGHTMSHGCVNMRQIDAKTIFDWSDGPTSDGPGTPVSICNQITKDNQCIQDNPVQ